MPASRARAKSGCKCAMSSDAARIWRLFQSYQPAGVMAIIAKSYQPVSTAASNTDCAFSWVERPK